MQIERDKIDPFATFKVLIVIKSLLIQVLEKFYVVLLKNRLRWRLQNDRINDFEAILSENT